MLTTEWNMDVALEVRYDEGRSKGRQEGRQEGRQAEQRIITVKFRQRGVTDDEIASIVNLPIERVREIRV